MQSESPPSSSSSSSLVQKESAVEWQTARLLQELSDKARAAILLETAAVSAKRISRFKACGQSWVLMRSKVEVGGWRWVRTGCRDRLCPRCSLARSLTIRHNLTVHLEKKVTRLITLTLAHRLETLAQMLARLYAAFRKLRQRTEWKNRVTGGVAFTEIVFNEVELRWHAHLHLLAEGCFYPQDELSKSWKRVTGDSSIVHITLVKSPAHALQYVTKYLTKAANPLATLSEEHALEFVKSIHGLKQIISFGSWRKLKLTKKIAEEAMQFVGTETSIQQKADAGDKTMAFLLRVLDANRGPCTNVIAVQIEEEPVTAHANETSIDARQPNPRLPFD